MSTKTSTAATLAKTLSPEDVRRGDYVAVLSVEYEWLNGNACSDSPYQEIILRACFRPRDPEPPLRVIDVCLPFVFVQPPQGLGHTIDIRSVRLARLDRNYARRVVRTLSKRRGKKQRPGT
ncbi:hypothetical protein [Botrimarina hoheduenensis]|uniref:Uncharacterized protein n=1 Tax=Botrimarina hoheduenensis TaxID=2528000 RepID=A0A5C5VQD0_9BACT|nr:hypothetical protein [Botrimarina hoheduenensis]TWT40253.1 hypothetical protein Pla111_33850 [Botrimarina hoheduenensis]